MQCKGWKVEFPTGLCRVVCRGLSVLASLQKRSSSCCLLSEKSCDAPGWWDQEKPMGVLPVQDGQDTRAGVARLGDTGWGHPLAEVPWAPEVGYPGEQRMELLHLSLL